MANGQYLYDVYAKYGTIKSTICGYDPPRSPCYGDSGGPFVCDEAGKAIVSGVISNAVPSNYSVVLILIHIVPKYICEKCLLYS